MKHLSKLLLLVSPLLSGCDVRLGKMMEIISWFERLASRKQIDEILILGLNDVSLWIQNLSTNQRVVLTASVFVLVIILKAMFGFMYRTFFKVRRWFRRKLIPRKVCLHLDRERNID